MILNSRVLAFLLALLISISTTAVLVLFNVGNVLVPIISFLISFMLTYAAVYFSFEFLVFREVNRIRSLIKDLKNKDLLSMESNQTSVMNPIQRINREIYTYAAVKQREIDELKKIEAFRKEFIANVSHELKTPIFAAQGFVHTLLDGAVKDKTVRRKFLKKAAKSLDGLDMLVQDLLILSQIETGEIRMNFEYFDLGRLVIDVIDQFEDKAEKKNVKLELEIEQGITELNVFADWQRIQQVLNNLISNAINYNNEDGSVTIHISRLEHTVKVSVRDTGIGIPPEDRARIFERFYRVDKSRSRARGGTGLGLAIVKHILEGHNSTIDVTSVVGEGTVFMFSLPREEDSSGVQIPLKL